MPEQRRIATLLAFAHLLEATAQDDAIDVLDMLVETMLDRASADGLRFVVPVRTLNAGHNPKYFGRAERRSESG